MVNRQRLAALVLGSLSLLGCGGPKRVVVGPVIHHGPARRFASADRLLEAVRRRNDGYRTMRAVHRVAIEISTPSGGKRQLTCRGVLAIDRPGRFRLTALGPAGVRLFDLLYRRGEVSVLQATPRLGRRPWLLHSVARDIGAIYRISPRPRATDRRMEETVSLRHRIPLIQLDERSRGRLVRQLTIFAASLAISRTEQELPGDRGVRTITYADYERHGERLVPRTLLVAREGPRPYWVSIRVERVELDVTLDPRLFETARRP